MVIFLQVFTFGVKTLCVAEQPESPSRLSFFFFEDAVHFYYAPEMFSDTVQPKPGIRVALGYGWQRLRVSLASGYVFITGTNPLVLDLLYIPLTLRLGYDQPLGQHFSIRADVGGGIWFSEANFYASALDQYMDTPAHKAEIIWVAEGRLSVTYILPGNFFQIYAGGNGYLLPETEGLLFRGAFEAGLVFRLSFAAKKPQAVPEVSPKTEKTAEEAQPVPAATEEPSPAAEQAAPEGRQTDNHEKAPARIERRRR
jgi:hypothetical protein